MKFEREFYQLEYAINRFFGTENGHEVYQESCISIVDGKEVVSIVTKRKTDSINLFEELSRLGVLLCGGAITSIFSNSSINDLDFYIKNRDNLADVDQLFKKYFKKEHESTNAITYVRKSEKSNKKWRIQLIKRFTGEPEEIFDWFDFTVTHGAYDFSIKDFVFGDRFFVDLSKRVLNYSGSSQYPICAMYRTKKYVDRGFKLPGATVMHIAISIVQLKIENYKDLKEQLMGIDTMYLQKLLEAKSPDAPVNYGEFVYDAFQAIDSIGKTLAEMEDEE